MKLVVFLVLIFVIMMSSVSTVDNGAFGLSCAPQTLNEIFENSDLVFLGTVISKEYWPPGTTEAKITFEIEEIFKGTYDRTIILSSNEEFWGFNFGENVNYVVFAQGGWEQNQYYSVALCTPVFYGLPSIVEAVRSLDDDNTEFGDIEAFNLYENLTPNEQIQLEKIQENENNRIDKEVESREQSTLLFSVLTIVGIILLVIVSVLILYNRLREHKSNSKTKNL